MGFESYKTPSFEEKIKIEEEILSKILKKQEKILTADKLFLRFEEKRNLPVILKNANNGKFGEFTPIGKPYSDFIKGHTESTFSVQPWQYDVPIDNEELEIYWLKRTESMTHNWGGERGGVNGDPNFFRSLFLKYPPEKVKKVLGKDPFLLYINETKNIDMRQEIRDEFGDKDVNNEYYNILLFIDPKETEVDWGVHCSKGDLLGILSMRKNDPEEIVETMLNITKENPENRVPIFDLKGNLYWPKLSK